VHGVPNPVIGGLCPGPPAPPPMSIVISVFVCLSFREHISRTTRPIFTKFLYVFPVLLWLRCDTLRTSGFWMASYLHIMAMVYGVDLYIK